VESKSSDDDGDDYPLRFDLFPGDEGSLRFSDTAVAEVYLLVSATQLRTVPFPSVVASMTQVPISDSSPSTGGVVSLGFWTIQPYSF
jgi:hypothetical protein